MPDSPAAEVFCHNVRTVMKDKDLSISKFAKQMNITRPGLSSVLSGKERVTLERAERIAKALGIPLVALLSDKFHQPA